MIKKIKPVIIAGGTGSRLWPLSRSMHPKQFLSFDSDYTMLQETILRLNGIETLPLTIVCNDEHRFFAAEQLRAIKKSGKIILETSGKNTAPAIALAALNSEPDDLLLVLSADHFIKDSDSFLDSVKLAAEIASNGKIVTFGVTPTQPHSGYGYIKAKVADKNIGLEIDKFVEKPSLEESKKFIASGGYFWNSGMFLFKASKYLDELHKFRPDIHEACLKAHKGSLNDLDFIRPDKNEFEKCPSDSIDYAVLEKTKDAVVIEMNAGWSDIGSWSSLWDISKKDSNGNVMHGNAIAIDSSNSFIKTDDRRIIATLGIENLIIIDTKDALLVADKSKTQDVKKIVDHLKENLNTEWEYHREVYRPWGKYDSIDVGDNFQVKRITVKPGAKLSLQKHHHRAEHWVVVKGEATVTKGEETFLLKQNQSVYIEIEEKHSLANLAKEPLELIEVQSGSYLGEDDIVRFEDVYGRS